MGAFVDLTGRQFGRLTVVERAGHKGRFIVWRCLCSCGETTVVARNHLANGHTRSCGCLAREMSQRKRPNAPCVHGHARKGSQHPLYTTWALMRSRCRNPRDPSWENYGGRGITVCERWNSFPNFLADMGEKPSLQHTLDRVDNEGNYEPGNCRWATRSEQIRNSRRRRKSLTATRIAKALGLTKAELREMVEQREREATR